MYHSFHLLVWWLVSGRFLIMPHPYIFFYLGDQMQHALSSCLLLCTGQHSYGVKQELCIMEQKYPHPISERIFESRPYSAI